MAEKSEDVKMVEQCEFTALDVIAAQPLNPMVKVRLKPLPKFDERVYTVSD